MREVVNGLMYILSTGCQLQIPVHRGQSFRRIADSVPVIADSFR
jgi:hypothetical protein